MDLKTFVSTTLVQIVEGVADAIRQVSERKIAGAINPMPEDYLRGQAKDVQFDVAVTVTDTSEGSAGAGIKVASFIEIGGKGSKATTSEAVSRIQFSVPVAVPATASDEFKVEPSSYQSEFP
jgi:hypothetical protein